MVSVKIWEDLLGKETQLCEAGGEASIPQEDRTSTNVHVPNNTAPIYVKKPDRIERRKRKFNNHCQRFQYSTFSNS